MGRDEKRRRESRSKSDGERDRQRVVTRMFARKSIVLVVVNGAVVVLVSLVANTMMPVVALDEQ